MAEGYLLSAASIKQLQADHRALRAAITRLERQLPPTTDNAPDWGREWWWGKLTKRDGDTYPIPPANAYTVRLASRTYDPTTPGNATLTDADSDPKQLITARSMHHGHMPEGLYVLLLRTGSTDGERWWILPPQTPLRRAIAQEAIASGGSGEVQIQDGLGNDDVADAYNDWGASPLAVADEAEIVVWWDVSGSKWRVLSGGTAAAAPRARCVIVGFPPCDDGYAWREGDGSETLYPIIGNDGVDNQNVKIFPTMVGTTSNSGGAVFTVEDTPAAYTDDWLTITQDGKYRAIVSFVWTLSPMSESDAEANLQDAGHVHNYTSPTGPAVTGSAQAGATALLRYVTTVGSLIEVDGAAGLQSYGERTSHEEYWYYASSPSSDLVRIWCTVIAYVERSTTDATINLKMSQHSGSSWSRANYRGCFATVEQISDS
jgi:hypothetical protein